MTLPTSASGPSKTVVLAEQWRRYKKTGDREARDKLIVAYSPIAKYAAGRIAARMPAHVDAADLVSYGLGGLIDAVERFQPDRGVQFESYAGLRIRGAIFDELRRLDWVPRSVRDEASAIDEALTALTASLQRTPTDGELAEKLSMDGPQLDASLQRVADAQMIALDEPWGAADGAQASRLDLMPDAEAEDPSARALATELRADIAEAIGQLPDTEQMVLGLRYHQQLTNSEIGEILDISESRVCQLHAKAVLRMRALLPGEHPVALAS